MSHRRGLLRSSGGPSNPRDTAESWVAYLEGLDRTTYTAGPDTAGLSNDFAARKQIITSNTTPVTDELGVTTAGLQPGHTYWNVQIDYIPTLPTSNGEIFLKNVSLRGPAAFSGGDTGLMKAYDVGHAYVTMIAGQAMPRDPSANLGGCHGYRFKMRHMDVSLVVDGTETFRGTSDSPAADVEVEIADNWHHDFAWFSQASAAAQGVSLPADGTHNDGLDQHQGGINLALIHNRVDGYCSPSYPDTFHTDQTLSQITSGVMYQKNIPGSQIYTATIEQNTFNGCRAQLNFNLGSQGSSANPLGDVGTLRSTRHGRDFSVVVGLKLTQTTFIQDVGTAGPPDTRNKYLPDLAIATLSRGD